MPTTPLLPETFGPALRLLRKRARLTQDELGRAVGYSREQIARLENGSRLPDLAVLAALFVPALHLERENRLVEQFMALAGQTRYGREVTLTQRRETRVEIVQEVVPTQSRTVHRPPAPLLPLIGREDDLTSLLERLSTTRLITLVGPPGVGKTRLAIALAHAAQPAFKDGVVFVSLAEVAGPNDIPYALLAALNVIPSEYQLPQAALIEYLAERNLLLVIDNCEHLLAGATLFTDWLTGAPELKLLATSRVPLDLYGEQEWPVAPLAVPDLAEAPTLERWAACGSLQLLVARAQAADPAFRLDEDNLRPLGALCVALDGLPLALELAASRLRDTDATTLIQQLLQQRGGQHLSSTWLQQSRRNVADRHRTMQAAINWSVHLLSPNTQRAFSRLGVFVGGCTTEEALLVAGAGAVELEQLSRASLIRLQGERVVLLETLRAFAEEELANTGQLADAQHEHARAYATFAKAVFDGLRGEDQSTWMQYALADHDNCLAALRWALATGNGDLAVAIARGLWWFWMRRGFFQLGRDMLSAALTLPSTDPRARADALNGLASIQLIAEDFEANLASHEAALVIRRALGDPEGIATVLHNLGLTAFTMGDYVRAEELLRQSVDVNPTGDPVSAWAHLGLIAQETFDLAQARQWLEMAYARVSKGSEGWLQAFVANYLADVVRELGELDRATELAQESLRLFITLDDPYYLPDVQITLAQIALDRGDLATADALAGVAFAQYEPRHDLPVLASTMLLQAEIAYRQGMREEAARLLARSRELRAGAKRAQSPREQAQYVALMQALEHS
jgi:predicted ATPase/transcriptional regulator with XRE-family HTH domain